MDDHPWPLKNKLPDGHEHFTRAMLIEFLDAAGVEDDSPIWIDNYRQIRHMIAQRPMEVLAVHSDGVHLG
ncbi:hypothetical protein [Agromyces humi]|uniref:hypothetical protein n=1 Tax=Agromyces humi TaxID=1766800 RepID=UPI001358240E|nr:hypothetical protein [Agromyces humi]